MREEIIANLKEYHSVQGIVFTSEEDSLNYYRGLVEIIEHFAKSEYGGRTDSTIGRQAIMDIRNSILAEVEKEIMKLPDTYEADESLVFRTTKKEIQEIISNLKSK